MNLLFVFRHVRTLGVRRRIHLIRRRVTVFVPPPRRGRACVQEWVMGERSDHSGDSRVQNASCHGPNECMDDNAFREAAGRVAEMIGSYWRRLREGEGGADLSVGSRVGPGEFAARLPLAPPECAEPMERILEDAARLLPDALTHWQHPSFFGYFPANISPPAILADMLSSGLGVQGMMWATSPAATELETRMLDWMAAALGLPDVFGSGSELGGGVIQGTASEATLVALLAARHAARTSALVRRGSGAGEGGAGKGGVGRGLVAYTSTQAHSSVAKAAMIAGLMDGPPLGEATPFDGIDRTRSGIRLVNVNALGAMRTDDLSRHMELDRAAGLVPCFVSATVGTTASCGVDDVGEIAGVAERHGAWLHVDAAYAGSAWVCPEHRGGMRAIERAHSVCMNPHKWLLTNFDCGLFWTRRRDLVTGALGVTPEYLRNTQSDAGRVWDYRDWQVPLGRRFRSLKLWFVLRAYGLEGLRAHIREHCRLADVFAQWVRADERFDLAVARPEGDGGLGLVCIALRPRSAGPALAGASCEARLDANARTKRLHQRLNETGRVYVSHAVLPAAMWGTDSAPGRGDGPGRYVIRVAIGGVFTREEHVRGLWSLMTSLAE